MLRGPMTVERAVSGDWERVRALRLRARRVDPDAFASTLEEEEARTPDELRARISGPCAATFLATRGGADVGVAMGRPHRGREDVAGLGGVWVAPEARGTGVGDELVGAVVGWARALGHRRLWLEVLAGNDAAIRLYERHGFSPTGDTRLWPGTTLRIDEYALVLDETRRQSVQIREFRLERYYAQYEFTTRFQLSASDCQTMAVGELLALAGSSGKELSELELGYTETRGAPELREAIEPFYPGCSAADVLVCNAPQEAIFLSMHAVLRPGDRVVVSTPCYPSLKEVARSIGCEVVEWLVAESPQGWALDLDRLEELLRERTRLVVTNVPHNPTGCLPRREEWERLCEIVTASGARWFSDEMYRGLERSADLALPPAASLTPRALSLWGASKSFGLPGLRIGWLVGRDSELTGSIESLKDYTTICSSAPGEVLARIALECADAILARNRDIVAANTAAMEAFVARHSDRLSWHPPVAGPVALARLGGGDAEAYAERVRAEGGALLVPGTFFDLSADFVRIGLGRADFDAALAAWERAGV